jgi:hypothetical protein
MSSPELNRVRHTFLSGKLSSTFIIPIDTARKYGLDKPANVVVEERPEGILIKKIEVWVKRMMKPITHVVGQ